MFRICHRMKKGMCFIFSRLSILRDNFDDILSSEGSPSRKRIMKECKASELQK
jgi:hypothetical protein